MEFVSIQTIMDRITRHPLMTDIPLETVIDYTLDFMRIVNIPEIFKEKVEEIPLNEYRAQLPCDFFRMIQMRIKNCHGKRGTFRTSTHSFHLSEHKGPNHKWKDLTYKIQGNVIFTNIKEGDLEIAYLAIPTDDDGLPSIPDNSSYLKALENYIKVQWFTILFDTGKIQGQVLNLAQQEYAWYVGQAQSSMRMPTIENMESISNMWNKLTPDTDNDHRHGYINEGAKEHLIIH